MDPHRTDDDDRIRALLRLKAHETPPPGTFESFSDRVITRIEAECGVRRYASVWERIAQCFDIRPMVAVAYGCVVVGAFGLAFEVSSRALSTSAGGGTSGSAAVTSLDWSATQLAMAGSTPERVSEQRRGLSKVKANKGAAQGLADWRLLGDSDGPGVRTVSTAISSVSPVTHFGSFGAPSVFVSR